MVKNLLSNAGDVGSVPVSGRSLVEENGNPLHYFYLKNLMDRGVRLATVHGVAKGWTQLRDRMTTITWTLSIHENSGLLEGNQTFTL